MSLIPELLDGIFSELMNKGFIDTVKKRSSPLISDYVIKYDGECTNVNNIDDDIVLEREWNWYEVLSVGVGSKLSINRVSFNMVSSNEAINLTLKLMYSDRLKSTEELPMLCSSASSQNTYVYGKAIIDLLMNEDIIERTFNMVKDRKKITNGIFDSIAKRIREMRVSVDQNLRKLVSSYTWFEV